MTRRLALLALVLVVGCGDATTSSPADTTDAAQDAQDTGLADADDDAPPSDAEPDAVGDTEDTGPTGCPPLTLSLAADGAVRTMDLTLPDAGQCTWEPTLDETAVIEWTTDGASTLTWDGAQADRPGWIAPRLALPGPHALAIQGTPGQAVTLALRLDPAPSDPIDRHRSLVWTDPLLLDDPDTIGLRRVLEATLGQPDGARLLDRWFRRFSTTAHSERIGPLLLLEDVANAQGHDLDAWDLDALPFVVTGVHNRIDLARGGHCGELRVSIASTHPLYQPLHLLFLFEQPALPEDRSPDGELTHCVRTALRWARLSALEGDGFRQAAATLLRDGLTPSRFRLAESVEFTVSPWEWRQWVPGPATGDGLPFSLDNPPLFQTVDTDRLNRHGPDRDAFLAWVEANADALDDRHIEIPEAFRAPSARVNAGLPWVPLDLTGVAPTVLERLPDLRRNVELMGCPACHATDAEFVQTRPDRTFSPFYDKELDARAAHLRALIEGSAQPPPFGPLQDNPVLPP